MSWIKRNLFFVVFTVVGLLLMGAAGWFAYTKWSQNNLVVTSLNTLYEELKGLKSKKPHPGDKNVNNIQIAKDQQLQISNFVASTYPHFEPIPRIPSAEEAPKINEQSFTTALSRTIDQLQREAANASVTVLCTNISFESEKLRVQFDPKGLVPLATQLGEVKTLCEILFQAKINSLDNIRRERVAAEDSPGVLQTDYLTERTVTNELAVLTPYEVVFKCFSSELASVLAGLASSPHGFVIKSINVEGSPIPPPQEVTPVAVNPTLFQPQVNPAMQNMDAEARMRARYGLGAGGIGGGGGNRYGGGQQNLGGIEYRGIQPTQPAYVAPVAPAVTPVRNGPLPTVLDERQLKVTLNLILVKLLPPKTK